MEFLTKGPALPPRPYGVFHLICLAFFIAVCAAVIIFSKNVSDKTHRRLLFGLFLSLCAGETIKQLIMSYDGGNWNYDWNQFPLFPCSTPLWILLCLPFLKNEKRRNACYWYMALYSMFGGISVMFYPATVFDAAQYYVFVYTMLWHSMLVWVGLYLIVSKRIIFDNTKNLLKNYIDASKVFLLFIGIAIILIFALHAVLPGDTRYNFMFISPFEKDELPVLGLLWRLPWLVWAPLYCLCFMGIAGLVLLVENEIHSIFTRKVNMGGRENKNR